MTLLMKEEDNTIELQERRVYRRIPANISVRYYFNNIFYTGTILNISESGLFLSTRKCLPLDSFFVVIVNTENKILKLIARVKRVTKNTCECDGLGISLLEPPNEYRLVDGGPVVAS